MAKDEDKGAAGPDADSSGKKGPGGMILGIVGAVLVGVGIGAGIFMGQRSRVPSAEPKPEKKLAQTIIFPLNDMFVNVAETKATRVLKLTPVFSLSEEGLKVEIEKYRPVLRDRISQIASRMTIDELEGRNGRDMLKREIKNSVNGFLREYTAGAVVDVYFSDFLIQ